MSIFSHLPAVDRHAQNAQEAVAAWRDGLPPDESASDPLQPLAVPPGMDGENLDRVLHSMATRLTEVESAVAASAGQEEAIEHPFGRKWRRKRFLVWLRDNFYCQYCMADLLRDYQSLHTATVDHIKPQSAGGKHDIDNLVTCCMCCNMLKGKQQYDSVEDARAVVAFRRERLMADFVVMAREFGVQFPRYADGPSAPALAALEAVNSLKAFSSHTDQVVCQMKQLTERVAKIGSRLNVLEMFRDLFNPAGRDQDGPEPAGWSPEADAPMEPLADQAADPRAVVCGSIAAGAITHGRELLDLVDQAAGDFEDSQRRAGE